MTQCHKYSREKKWGTEFLQVFVFFKPRFKPILFNKLEIGTSITASILTGSAIRPVGLTPIISIAAFLKVGHTALHYLRNADN